MSTTERVWTADELLHTPDLGRCELIRGELVMMSPAGFDHGRIIMRIASPLDHFVVAHDLGTVVGAETGFLIARNPDTVRAPDVGFVRKGRISGTIRGFFPGAPDLAVEVTSVDDRAPQVLAKVQDWLTAGCQSVWVANPITSTVELHRAGREKVRLTTADVLVDEPLLPGFSLSVAEVFRV